MTPKEKARSLVYSFYELPQTDLLTSYLKLHLAKISALIAVDEIIEYALDWHEYETPNKAYEYWQEVKQEIEKL
jgi:hypothetical protein